MAGWAGGASRSEAGLQERRKVDGGCLQWRGWAGSAQRSLRRCLRPQGPAESGGRCWLCGAKHLLAKQAGGASAEAEAARAWALTIRGQ